MIVMTMILTRLTVNSSGFRAKSGSYWAKQAVILEVPAQRVKQVRIRSRRVAGSIFSEEPQRVRHAQPAAHFGRKLLNKREMIAIKRVSHVVEIERDDVRQVLFRN